MGASQSDFIDCASSFNFIACQPQYKRKKRLASSASRDERNKPENLTGENVKVDAVTNKRVSPRQYQAEVSRITAPNKPTNTGAAGFKNPEPIKGWSTQQQQILIEELRNNPKARKSQDGLKEVFLTVQKSMPEKSRQEIEECYRHLQSNRIAYFCPNPRRPM
jgi:hypothetical protein